MSIGSNRVIRDMGLRLGGAALVTAGVFALGRAEALEKLGPLHPGIEEYVLAAIGFLALSAGAMLLIMGIHIFDRVPLSSRWANIPNLDQQPSDLASRSADPAL
ncbi:hypothetical protein [Sphingomonas crocodyli]|uniref:Uncharacterized protein n=1 Tax=Sphingomonas crocodyli TaxID=1979270 RepID=A0A437M6S8_9SPHN|nr:hypothetical protein [Sphingomonas crocodyli]RVT93266.1 hypothetical protein EOD43_05085 [Sphingomonas crocodyli]